MARNTRMPPTPSRISCNTRIFLIAEIELGRYQPVLAAVFLQVRIQQVERYPPTCTRQM